MPKMRKKMKNL